MSTRVVMATAMVLPLIPSHLRNAKEPDANACQVHDILQYGSKPLECHALPCDHSAANDEAQHCLMCGSTSNSSTRVRVA